MKSDDEKLIFKAIILKKVKQPKQMINRFL
jgi:hypothetical protein